MQADGVQVNPRERWDEHCVQDPILSKLAPESDGAKTEKTEAAVETPHKAAGKRARKK
jgi:hypothetical protein